MTVGVIILTLNASPFVARVLRPVLASRCVAKVLVVDSESSDDTVSIAESLGAQVLAVRRTEFNHGATRELARKLIGTDIVIFLTQDVVPLEGFLELLISPILSGKAVVSYSRQLPHLGAGFFEAFPREFNYPDVSENRSLKDCSRLGVATFFCSNSCAAYLNPKLDDIGGFKATLTNEDYFAVAALLRAGYCIQYVAESKVLHSHRYSLVEEFKRYFDTGYVRAENPWVNELVGAAEVRGMNFFREIFLRVFYSRPQLLPYALVQTGMKWLGYRVGFLSLRAPLAWKKMLSGQPYYWSSRFSAR